MMQYRSRKHNPQNSEALSAIAQFASANKLYSGLMASIVLSALLALFLPSANARRIAENATTGLGGGLIAVAALDGKLSQAKAKADRSERLSKELGEKFAAQELAVQKERLTIQSRESSLKTLESTYRQRCDNEAAKRLQRDTDAAKRKIEADARAKVREADSRAVAAQRQADKAASELAKAKATHERALTEAKNFYQAESDKAILAKQVELDRALQLVEKAKADARNVRAEFETHQQKLDELEKKRVVSVNRAIDATAQSLINQYESEAAKVDGKVITLAEKFRYETAQRAALKAEVDHLRKPKVCTLEGVTGDIARKIQGAVHGLTVERTSEGRRYQENLGYRMHWINPRQDGLNDVYMFEVIGNTTAEDISKHRARIQKALPGVRLDSITYNPERACTEFAIAARKKEVVRASDFARLVKPEKFYLQRAATWSRAQFLAPSESGKTSSAEILGYQWAAQNDADRFFHYPNKESNKNYVTAKIASVGAEECAQSFADLVHLVDDIQDGRQKPLAKKQHHVFDDSDSIISKALDGLATREEVLDFFTRASHCGIGFTLIGHSTAANRQGGMTHSDFNNLTRIYAGLDILTALKNTQVVSASRADALITQFEKIRDRFDTRNSELGLISEGTTADPGAYRFVLVIEGNKPPYFCELPALDMLSASAEVDSSATPQSHLNPPLDPPQHTSVEGQSKVTIGHSRPVVAQTSAQSKVKISKPTSAPKCRKCRGKLFSQGIAKSGTYKGQRKYQCKSQKHKPEMGTKTFYYDV